MESDGNLESGEVEENEVPPPPYESPNPALSLPAAPTIDDATKTPQTQTPTPSPFQWTLKTSAERFTLSTLLLALTITTAFLTALGIQSILHCQRASAANTATQATFWIFYAALLVWVLRGVSCWLVLLRDLWPREVRERWRFAEREMEEHLVLAGVLVVVCAPAGVVLWGAWNGGVWVVEGCQRVCCGGGGDGEGEEGGEEVESGREESEGFDDVESLVGEESEERRELLSQ